LPPQFDLDEEDFTEEDREELARRIRSNMDIFLADEGGLKCPVTVCGSGCEFERGGGASHQVPTP
jgi:hypothetical protein